MKKINKFLTIFGAIAPISALPFIAAKCDTTDSSSTNNKEDDKNNKDENKNNPEVNNSTNTDTDNKDGGQGTNSTPSENTENSQTTPGSREESNNSATTPNSNGGSSNESGGGNSPREEMPPVNDEATPSDMPAPETDRGSGAPESTQPSDHGGNGTQGSGTEGTTPRNGESTNSEEQPMGDDPGTANNETEAAESEPEKKLEVLYTFFNGYGNIEEKLKTEYSLKILKNEFDSTSNKTIKSFNKGVEDFLKKFSYEEADINDLSDIFDDVTNLTSSSEPKTNSKEFLDKFAKVKAKLTEAYNMYTKQKK